MAASTATASSRGGLVFDGVDAVDQLGFNHQSVRAAKARLAAKLKGAWLYTLQALVLILVLGGVALLAMEQAVGWIVLCLSALPAMVVEWYESDLKKLKPAN